MPDRYGETPDPELQPSAKALELRALAMTIGCRYCHAEAGFPCVNNTLPDKPNTRIPHTARTNDAIEVPF